MSDTWFNWYEEEAVELLSTVYENPEMCMSDVKGELSFGDSVYRRLIRECRERSLIRTQRGKNLGRERVTERGKRFLLRRDPPRFLREKLQGVIEA